MISFRPIRHIKVTILLVLSVCTYSAHATDYYWVGGGGNWSDITHWVTTSGGGVQHNSVPSAEDNVFFDGNSFTGINQTVTINNQNVFCASMNWTGATGNPILIGPEANALNVSGDLILNADMQFQFAGDIRLNGDGLGDINTFGHPLNKILQINGGPNSTWTLIGDLEVDSLIEINSGGLNTNGMNVQVPQFLVFATSPTTLDLSSSTIEITGSLPLSELRDYFSYPTFGINTDNTTISEGTSTIRFTGRFPMVRIYGNQNIRFNDLLFSSSVGTTFFNHLIDFRGRYQYFYGETPMIITNRIAFSSNAILFADHMTGAADLAPGKSYKIQNQRTWIINQITANGDCGHPITINTVQNGQPAIFQFNQDQTVQFVNLRNIHAMGPGNFLADNSSNLGNNSGWSFTERVEQTLYWVGGRGRWSDPMHWSLSSGGLGGACIPSPSDIVIFDQNSFSGNDTVRIDVDDALCKDMIWESIATQPVFTSRDQQRLNIFRSLQFDPNTEVDLLGDVYFLTNEDASIRMGGKRFSKNVFFNGSGTWSLLDSFEVLEYLYFVSGHINTNSHKLIFERFEAETNLQRSLTLGSSEVEVRSERGWWTYLRIYSVNFTLDAGTSQVNFLSNGNMDLYGDYDLVNELDWYKIRFYGFGGFYSHRSLARAHTIEIFGNGEVAGDMEVGRLFLNPGYSYTFTEWDPDKEQIFIDTLDASGQCNRLINIQSQSEGLISRIFSNRNQSGSYLILENMHFMDATFTASQSIDKGNNQGWIIDSVSARDLYWVGGSGSWEETEHWSLVSGGTGGECVPTPNDNVFFDENSFSDPFDVVVANFQYSATCRNFMWDGPPETVRFTRRDDEGYCCGNLFIFGSLDIRTPLEFDVDEIIFRGDEEGHIIHTSGESVYRYYFRGETSRTMLDSLYTYYMAFSSGGLKTNNNKLNAEYIDIVSYYSPFHWDLDTSYIVLRGEGNLNYGALDLWGPQHFTIDPGQSILDLTHPQIAVIRWTAGKPLHDIIFSAPTGVGYLYKFGNQQDRDMEVPIHKLEFNSDGYLYGNNTFDSLLFANGRSYTLESEKIQTVKDHLQIRGNNCIQLRLQSSQNGNPSIIEKSSGTVEGDFIQMQDQIARGGATFLAGANSANISNNTGWEFESGEEYVEFGLLGDDVVFCKGETSLTINEEDLVGAISYEWNDGSTDAQLVVNGPGTFWLSADYTNNCTLIDTIRVLEDEDFQVQLGEDQVLCPGEVLNINADLDLTGASYTWNDGFEGASRILDSTASYALQVELNGCINADTLNLGYVEIPDFGFSDDATVCEGDTVTLDPSLEGISIQWSNGSSDPVLMVTQSGTYWLSISKSGCEATDTFAFDFITPPQFDLGEDLLICEQDQITLDAFVSNATYSWSTGETTASIAPIVESSVTYSVMTSFGNCTTVDSIQVAVKPLPEISLGTDFSFCPDDSFELVVTSNADSIFWPDGTNDLAKVYETPGTYEVMATLNGCSDLASVTVSTFETNFVPLGNDTLICDDVSLSVDVSVVGGMYTWSDGSTEGMRNLEDAGVYEVTVFDGNCTFSDAIELMTRECVYFSLYAPNIFSPNADGVNDVFKLGWDPLINIQEYSFSIFDRWGNLVFTTTDPDLGWDGTDGSTFLASDVYVYALTMDYIDDNGPGSYQGGGDVLLMK